MKAIKLSMLALLLAAGTTAVKAQNADEIIKKHIDAIGGTENWNKINSIKKIGSMNVQGMEISYNETVVKGKGMRTDISAMGQDGYVILTPTEGWMYMPFQGVDKVTALPADQVKAAQEKIDVRGGMLTDKAEITKAEYLGMDTIDAVACYKVKITDKAGNDRTDFFDAKTFYLVRTEAIVTANEQENEVAVSYSNYQKQPEGITLPLTTTSPMGGGEIVVKSIEINKPIDENIFKPATDK